MICDHHSHYDMIASLTTKQGSFSQPMVSKLSGTPSRSVSLLHSLPLPMSGSGHCIDIAEMLATNQISYNRLAHMTVVLCYIMIYTIFCLLAVVYTSCTRVCKLACLRSILHITIRTGPTFEGAHCVDTPSDLMATTVR